MRSVLTLTGSILYVVVMIIISPLLLLVYTSTGSILVVRQLRQQNYSFNPFTKVSLPNFRVPEKKQAYSMAESA